MLKDKQNLFVKSQNNLEQYSWGGVGGGLNIKVF